MTLCREIRFFCLSELAERIQRSPDAVVWLDENGVRTWRDFGLSIEAAKRLGAASGITAGTIVVIPGEARFESLVWLFGLCMLGAVVVPLREERRDEVESWRQALNIEWRVGQGKLLYLGPGEASPQARRLLDQLKARQSPGLVLSTGGTTGEPKLVLHDLASLLATVPSRDGPAIRILPLMRFDHIGGLDIAWRALAAGQTIIAPPLELTPQSVGYTIERFKVEVMPATPSFLNLLLLSGVQNTRELSSLRTIPYGAETMPKALLARLKAAFPQVEFRQRFGTSETGVLPVSDHDGAMSLPEERSRFSWKVCEGELWVRSPSCAIGYLIGDNTAFLADGWFRTGDAATQNSDGDVEILGRRSELINVGGEKVGPEEVEAALLMHPMVRDCWVRGKSNVLLGQIPVAEIVWSGSETSPLVVKKILHGFLSGRLARHKLPSSISLVTEIHATRNLKKRRAP